MGGPRQAPFTRLRWAALVRRNGSSQKNRAPGAELGEAPSARRIAVRKPPPTGLVALTSRSHLDTASEAYLARWRVTERRAMGSSLKFCLIAEGKADLYPRLAPTREWDTAAGHAVLAAAGGDVLTPESGPLRYGKAAATIFARRISSLLAGSGLASLCRIRRANCQSCEYCLPGAGRIAFGIDPMPSDVAAIA